ncbi:MAG: DUF6489 family protein [Alphaproteobacteria bacterium]|nr:DUF6489 family protein [Alphaproteobacteria bacterium]
MKVTVNIECTPEEARAFMGLPDVQPMQENLLRELEARLSANIKAMNPESVIKTWLPASLEGAEKMQKMFWSHMQQAVSGMTSTASSAMGGFGGKSGE